MPHRVLPDGCIELILQRGDPDVEQHPGSRPRLQPPIHVTGQLERFFLLAARGRIDTLGVRFRPGAARALLRVPDGELTGRTIGLGGILGDARRRELESAAGEPDPLSALIDVCDDRLDPGRQPDGRLRAAVGGLLASAGRLPIAHLAEELSLDRRTLLRLFKNQLGLRPKQLARIARLGNTLLAVERGAFRSLADLACSCGYSDQAHLSREFRDLTGLSPTDWLRERPTFARQFTSVERLERILSGSETA
jgi:AraC-like DNA-binding protein